MGQSPNRVFDDLDDADRKRLEQLEQYVATIAKDDPLLITTVVAVQDGGRRVLVNAGGGGLISIASPSTAAKVGSQLRAFPAEKKGFDVLPEPIAFGAVGTVDQLDGGQAAVRVDGAGVRFVGVADGLALAPGDRVVLDNANLVALKKLPPLPPKDEGFEAPPQTVSWSDIGGQLEAIEALRDAVEYPARYPKFYERHGQKPARGAVLYGPPGTGKSMLGKALASSLGGDTRGFIYVKATEVFTRWQGEAGATVRRLFARGRRYQAETGKRAVLFVDEADELLKARGGGGVSVGTVEDMVPVFLAEMDGLEALGPFVLLATNRIDRIDPAVLRDGRCELKLHVARPTQAECEAIFKLALRGRSVAEGLLDDLAQRAAEELFRERHILLELTYPGVRTSEYLRLSDLVSGAMVHGIVQRAAAVAIKRDRENGCASRLCDDDIDEAVRVTLRQQASVNHEAVIREKSKSFGKLPEKVRQVIDG